MSGNASADDRLIDFLASLAVVIHEPYVEDHPPEEDFDDDTIPMVRAMSSRSPWGWCIVKTTITVLVAGEALTASACLGGCSYPSKEAWMRDNAKDQTLEACAQLLHEYRQRVESGKRAQDILKALRAQARRKTTP